MKDETDLKELKELGYYVIRTDDGDRYLREVYAKNELVSIENSNERAYLKLGEIVETNLFNNNL